MGRWQLAVAVVAATARPAAADTGSADTDAAPAAPAASDAVEVPPPGKSFVGPFQSSRLFTMPVADVVGAYMVSFSGEASSLQDPGVLVSSSVVAIGFGDIAQLEYRHSSAISASGAYEPLPAAGVQLKLPLPERPGIPAIGVAFRLGVPNEESFDGASLTETVTDFYAVARWNAPRATWLTLHAGARVSSSSFSVDDGAPMPLSVHRVLTLPTAGVEVTMNPHAKLVGELAAAPAFHWDGPTRGAPTIGYGAVGRLGMRWRVLPELSLDASLGYQVDSHDTTPDEGLRDVVQQWDIRLGAEVFVPWGAVVCRAAGWFCEPRPGRKDETHE